MTEVEARTISNDSEIYTKNSPSPRYQELLEMYGSMHKDGRPDKMHKDDSPDDTSRPEKTFRGGSLEKHIPLIATLIDETCAKTVLDFGAGKGGLYSAASGYPIDSRYKSLPEWGCVVVTCYDPGYEPFSGEVAGRFDGVISTDVIEHIPEQDVAWFLDDLFSRANRFVYVVAACYPAAKLLPDGSNAHCTLRPPTWWKEQLELAASRNPGIRWVLCAQEKSIFALADRKKLFKKLFRKGIKSTIFRGDGHSCVTE
ncbi:class I SAM-dependent methyltransferase [Porticoccus sp.]